jgi:hypothetical protein
MFIGFVFCFWSTGHAQVDPHWNHTFPNQYGPANVARIRKTEKVTFKIQFLNDSILQTKGRLDYSTKQHFLEVKVFRMSRSILPEKTKSIVCSRKDGTLLEGIASDSCWLFLAMRGKILGYSPLPEMSANQVTAIRQGEGPIVLLTRNNLLQMIGDPSPEVKSLIASHKLVAALKAYNWGVPKSD